MQLFFFFHLAQCSQGLSMLRTSLVAQTVKNLPATQETWVWSLDWEDPLEEGMETHSNWATKHAHIHIVACISMSFFYKAKYYSIIWIYHILLIHSLFHGHVGCFQLLAILWVMPLQKLMCKILCGYMFSFLLSRCQGVELLGHIVTLHLPIWGTARLFSKVGISFHVSCSSVWRVLISPHPHQYFLLIFYNTHPRR